MHAFGKILRKVVAAWFNDDTFTLGAALAYYAVFSISPLLIIALSITGFFYKGESAGYIENEIAEFMGENAAKVIAGTIESVNQSKDGLTATILSLATLFVGASGVFVQLQYAMNRIWGVTPQPGRFFKDFFKQRLVSFAMIVGVGFLLLISLVLSAALAALNGYFSYLVPAASTVWYAVDLVLSFAVVTFVFAAIFKIVPDVDVMWSDVWLGAILTAVLFGGCKFAIGFYLGRSGIGSAFGAAGSLLVVLAWVFYCSQILFLGAEFTKIYSQTRHHSVSPAKGAEASKILMRRFFCS
jgi:membrane protein